ncbi:Ribonuclease R [Aggregatibacter aphrophilus]|uniref:Ribonuclease R n=1 Tax=Aggregatibacter aphrophilus TaxID=732 RepID=A0A336NH41_AGGAP|nr:Ribonuclease R [Aggregatibacter aphrophilus]
MLMIKKYGEKNSKIPPKDPNYAKELAKYDNPIPSREFILQIIREQNSPMSREEIFAALGISEGEQQEAMRRRLRAMENDGQLVFTKRKCYALPEKLDLLKGMVIGHREGFGFLHVEGKKKTFYSQRTNAKSHARRLCVGTTKWL